MLDGLAATPSQVHVLTSGRLLGPVVLLSSSDAGDEYTTVELLGAKHCARGCSPG